MKRILVIEREFGAGGTVIARELARRLGWKLLDHELTEQIAALAKLPCDDCVERAEKLDPWLYRMAKVFWRGSHERSVALPDSDVVDADRLVNLTRQVIEHAAEEGSCVIVGRGAAYFLRERDDVFCVFLYAPRDVRYQRILASVDNEAKALELVDSVDQQRRDFVKHYFGAEWPSRHLYDVMLNTRDGEDATINVILSLLSA